MINRKSNKFFLNRMGHQSGVSLIELIMYMSIVGLIVAYGFSHLKVPIETAKIQKQRMLLTDSAFIITQQLKKDIQRSLPNSIRTFGNSDVQLLEFVPIVSIGKYRVEKTATNTGDVLDFSIADSSFDIQGQPMLLDPNWYVSVYNVGDPLSDIYAGTNRTQITSVAGSSSSVNISPKHFPLQDPGERFFVTKQPQAYICDKATKTITKYWDYGFIAAYPSSGTLNTYKSGSSALVAKNVEDCTFSYLQGSSSRHALLGALIKLSDEQQSVSLYGETHVINN